VFTNTYPQGFPAKTLEKGIFNGDSVYYVFFTAEAAKFNNFLPTVRKMINSFELERQQPKETLRTSGNSARPSQALSACERQIFPGTGQIGNLHLANMV
jgi:hypothetical protein